MTVIDEMVEAADAYAKRFTPSGLSAAPSRQVTVVACMDARLDLFDLLGLEIGDAHLLRNAGGSVTDDTIRSLIISQRFLGTRETMLIHHTGCGMTSFRDDELLEQLELESDERPTWSPGAFTTPEEDVRSSLERVRNCPWLISTASRGFVFDVTTGHLNEVTD
jgi:carbonic anhydrase